MTFDAMILLLLVVLRLRCLVCGGARSLPLLLSARPSLQCGPGPDTLGRVAARLRPAGLCFIDAYEQVRCTPAS